MMRKLQTKTMCHRFFVSLIYILLLGIFWGGLYILFFDGAFYGTNTQEGDCIYSSPSYFNGFWDGLPCQRTKENYFIYLFILPFYVVASTFISAIREKLFKISAIFLLLRTLALYALFCGSILLLTASHSGIIDSEFVLKVMLGSLIALSPIIIYDVAMCLRGIYRERKRKTETL